MNRRHFLSTSALAAAAALSACGIGEGGAPTQDQDAAQRFLTERNGGTPVVLGQGVGQNMPVAGFLDRIDGQRLTVKSPIEGASAIVELAAGAKIHKDVDAQLSEIKAGDTILAVGKRQGDTLKADLVRLGGDPLGGPIVFDHPVDASSAPPAGGDKVIVKWPPGGADQAAAGDLPQPVSGTVEKVDGQTITLKDQGGASVAVQLADGAKIQKPAEVPLAELQTGMFVMATGSRSGDTFQATELHIMPPPAQP
jgi:hypothetical protein